MIEDIRRELEAWIGETELATARGIDPAAIAARFPLALSARSEQAAEDAVVAAEAKGDPALLGRHRALRAGIAWARLSEHGREAEALAEERLRESRAVLPDGTAAGWSSLVHLRGRAPARSARAAGERAMAEAAETAAGARQEARRLRREEAQRRGAKDERGVFERLDGVDLAKLAADARRFLDATRDVYRENLTWLLRRHDASIDTAEAHDLDWARHEMRDAVPAPAERMSQALEDSLRELGLDPVARGRLHVGPAATTHAVRRRVPGDVRLFLHPEDGLPAWSAALGAWGSALAAAWTPAALRMEERILGDEAVPLAWSALLALIPLDRDWIARLPGSGKTRDAARELQALHLSAARRLAGLLEAEIDLAAGATPREAAERLTAATLARFPHPLLLGETSAWFRTAHRLRAAAGAASIAALLRTRFDSWPRNGETGNFLLAAFALGRQSSLPGLLETLGAEPDTFGAMTRRFHELLA